MVHTLALLMLALTLTACSTGAGSRVQTATIAATTVPPVPTEARPPEETRVAIAAATGISTTPTATLIPTPTPPPGCSGDEITAFVERFLDVQGRGDTAALRPYFPQQGSTSGSPDHLPNHFQWYSMTEGDPQRGRQHFVAYRLDDLWPYFAARHQQHERFQLVRLTNALVSYDGVANIGYTLTREADDRPLHGVSGKGAINCKDQTIIVWSMGTGAVVPATPDGTATR